MDAVFHYTTRSSLTSTCSSTQWEILLSHTTPTHTHTHHTRCVMSFNKSSQLVFYQNVLFVASWEVSGSFRPHAGTTNDSQRGVWAFRNSAWF